MKKFQLVQATLLSICLSVPLAISGCNTVAGAGKDIQKGGEGIQKIATPKKNNQSQQDQQKRKHAKKTDHIKQRRVDMSSTEQKSKNDNNQMTDDK